MKPQFTRGPLGTTAYTEKMSQSTIAKAMSLTKGKWTMEKELTGSESVCAILIHLCLITNYWSDTRGYGDKDSLMEIL